MSKSGGLLDRAAWGAIISEGTYSPLPKDFHGSQLELRVRFLTTPIRPSSACCAPHLSPSAVQRHGSSSELPHQQVPLAQSTAAHLSGRYVALRKEVASQAVGDLVGIDLVVLFLGRCNRTQHQRVCHLDLGGVRISVAAEFSLCNTTCSSMT
jgi:hypothetical protein